MQIKKFNDETIDKVLKDIWINSKNVSKAKKVGELVGKTPKDEGHDYKALSEIDICYSEEYKTWSIKVYYNGTKKTYKMTFDSTEYFNWVSFVYSYSNRNKKSIFGDME